MSLQIQISVLRATSLPTPIPIPQHSTTPQVSPFLVPTQKAEMYAEAIAALDTHSPFRRGEADPDFMLSKHGSAFCSLCLASLESVA